MAKVLEKKNTGKLVVFYFDWFSALNLRIFVCPKARKIVH